MAQNGDTTVYPNPYTEIANVYSELDSTLIPYGMLEDRTVRYLTPSNFRGDLAYHDSISMNITAYGTMLMSVFGMTYAPDTAIQFMKTGYMDAIQRESDTLSLAVLYARTSKISDNILLDTLMTLDTTTQRFYDVLPRSQSPYIEKRIFAFAPHSTITPGQSFLISLPLNALATNVQNSSFELDAGDGLGFR